MMRYNNVEFRQPGIADSHGYRTDEDRPSEIIAWIYSESLGKETCITICWLKPTIWKLSVIDMLSMKIWKH